MKKDENVKLYALSVDPPDVSKTFAEKIAADGKVAINFPILSDPDIKSSMPMGYSIPLTKDSSSTASRIRQFM